MPENKLTPIQDFLTLVQKHEPELYKKLHKTYILKNYLDDEKVMIANAWTVGWNDRGNDDGSYSDHESGEDYYKKTYGKPKLPKTNGK